MYIKKPISERAQAIIMLCLIAFLLLGSVVLWIIYHTWYAGLIHWVVLYFMEWGARAKQDDLTEENKKEAWRIIEPTFVEKLQERI